MTLNDVKAQGDVIVVKIPKTKTNIIRSFTIENEYAAIVRTYMILRPPDAPTNRFFLNYRKGECTVPAQPIGKNQFLRMPKMIANFLDLPDAENYTGLSYRRTPATLLANSLMDTTTVTTVNVKCEPEAEFCHSG